MSSNFIAVPWYDSEEDFKAILELVPFEESKDAISYQEFVAYTQRKEDVYKAKGKIPFRVVIYSLSVKEWCNAHDVFLCGAGITQYAIKKMIEAKGL
jgi:hypothetical protein